MDIRFTNPNRHYLNQPGLGSKTDISSTRISWITCKAAAFFLWELGLWTTFQYRVSLKMHLDLLTQYRLLQLWEPGIILDEYWYYR